MNALQCDCQYMFIGTWCKCYAKYGGGTCIIIRISVKGHQTYLGSFEHFPFIEQFHGVNIVCVSEFDDSNLHKRGRK